MTKYQGHGLAVHKLVRPGPEKSWSYGIEAFGLSTALETKVRGATADACYRPGKQSCPIITIGLTLGFEADPFAIGVRGSIAWWVQTWYALPGLRSVLKRAWGCTPGPGLLKNLSGPTSRDQWPLR